MEFPNQEDVFQSGLNSFNRGRFFEAHESWEEIWRQAKDPEKVFLQALIQAALGLYHDGRGKPGPGARMAGKALKNLERSPDVFHGIRTSPIKAWLNRRVTGEEVLEPPRIEVQQPEERSQG